jgi:hypothetical protein
MPLFSLLFSPAIDEPNEIAIWFLILSTGAAMIRVWWKTKVEGRHAKKVEKDLEENWEHGDDTLTGSKNPGRTTAQLIGIVHSDLQLHKKETGRKFDRLIGDVGKIKGKLDIQ